MTVTLTESLRLAAAVPLLVAAGLLLRDHRRSRVTAPSLLLVGCVSCYLAMPVLLDASTPEVLRRLGGVGALAVPFAFWLAARIYFDDSFETGAPHVAGLLALLVARALVLPWRWAVSAIAIVVVVDAIRRIHDGAGTDLLLPRLRLRYVVVLGSGVYALLVLVGEAMLRRGSGLEQVLNAANDVGLLLLVVAVSMTILRVEPELVRAARRTAAAEPPTILERRLERLLEEKVYRSEGLTIGGLAERLGEHEYKVRQLINSRLGFRNFGAFLNHYRIQDARETLADPGQKHLGVAEVAFGLGYSSLGPFNRAFKELVGQTPTDYRKAALDRTSLADSGIGEAPSKRS